MILFYILINTIGHIILYPLKLLIALASYFLWMPGLETPLVKLFETSKTPSQKHKEYIKDIQKYLQRAYDDKDGAKTIGLFVDAMRTVETKEGTIPSFAYLLPFFTKDGFRRTAGNLAFSRDMDAGVLCGLWRRKDYMYFADGKLHQIASSDTLRSAIRNTVFKKPYLKHAGSGHRGHLFKWWFLGDHWLATLAWLGAYSHIFPQDKYLKWLYRYVFVISFPLPFINPETSIFLGRFMAVGWYNAHSRMLNASLMHEITGNPLYLLSMYCIVRKYNFNPEIFALACLHYDLRKNVKEHNYYVLEFVNSWLMDYRIGWEKIPKGWNKAYFNLENFINDGTIKTWYANRILSSRYRNTMYDWSKKMIKNEDHGDRSSVIDFIHLYSLYKKLEKKYL